MAGDPCDPDQGRTRPLSDAKGYQADADSGAYQESWLRRWRWPLIMVVQLFGLAYLAAFVTYRIALALGAG